MTEISKICFGCEPLGGVDWGDIDLKSIARAIDRAVELGVNCFDTAAVYGPELSEFRLAEILGKRRHKLIIATKGGLSWSFKHNQSRAIVIRDSSPKAITESVEGSLRRLKLDYLPIYYIHWPDPNTEIDVTFECLARLKNEGKIEHVGCSNFTAAQIKSAVKITNISFVQMPINLLGSNINHDLRTLMREENIKAFAYNVLASGLLSGKFSRDTKFKSNDRRSRLPIFQSKKFARALEKVEQISAVAQQKGMSCTQYAIDHVLADSEVVSTIVGAKSVAQIEENCKFIK